MKATLPLLTGSHLRAYETIFQHPISHNLEWHEVYGMFRDIGQVEEQTNGNLKVTRNGLSMMLHPTTAKHVTDADAVMELRHFLQHSETAAINTDHVENEAQWLLVIDHHEARIFRSETPGTVPVKILPPAPEEYFRHAAHSLETSRGKEKPNPNTFFEPVAKALQAAGRILIFGTGTGTSSEMEQFVEWAHKHHPALAKRIIGTLSVNESHLTEPQLLAKARDFYANANKAV